MILFHGRITLRKGISGKFVLQQSRMQMLMFLNCEIHEPYTSAKLTMPGPYNEKNTLIGLFIFLCYDPEMNHCYSEFRV